MSSAPNFVVASLRRKVDLSRSKDIARAAEEVSAKFAEYVQPSVKKEAPTGGETPQQAETTRIVESVPRSRANVSRGRGDDAVFVATPARNVSARNELLKNMMTPLPDEVFLTGSGSRRQRPAVVVKDKSMPPHICIFA